MASRKRLIALEQFHHLWRTDDPDWVARRKQDWRKLLAQGYQKKAKASERKHKAGYFVYGEKHEYIHACTQFFLTPLDSPETAWSFFKSDVFDAHDRKEIVERTLFHLYIPLELPWVRDQFRFFVDGIFWRFVDTGACADVESKVKLDKTFWCKAFVAEGCLLLQGEYEYCSLIEGADYLPGLLVDIDASKWRSKRTPDLLLEEADRALASDSISEDVHRFAQSLKSQEATIRANWEAAKQRAEEA